MISCRYRYRYIGTPLFQTSKVHRKPQSPEPWARRNDTKAERGGGSEPNAKLGDERIKIYYHKITNEFQFSRSELSFWGKNWYLWNKYFIQWKSIFYLLLYWYTTLLSFNIGLYFFTSSESKRQERRLYTYTWRHFNTTHSSNKS